MAIREQTKDLNIVDVLYNGEGSIIYKLDDGRLYKEAKPFLLSVCARTGVNYEQKLLSTCAATIGEIVSPITVAYTGRYCTGFTMENILGDDLNTYDDTFTLQQRSDLVAYANLFTKLESVVKRANKVGIVMPDLCTCDNIMVQPNGELKFIDYDGMQINGHRSPSISTSLGNSIEIMRNPKYCDKSMLYTKEEDKK